MRTYVIEPQQIFVPSLLHVLQESGLAVVRVTNDLDPPDVIKTRPGVLFCDSDALDDRTVHGIRFLLDTMPNLEICLYSRLAPDDMPLRDCARLTHFEKSASSETLRTALKRFALQ